jgi:hypothetical protein
MPDRLEKLWKKAKKTGFPLEMKVIETLVNRGWTVYSSSTYFDEDEDRKPRELDVKAIKNYDFGRMRNFSNTQYSLHVTLTIQCKQSTKHGWVFFPVVGRREFPRIQHTDFLRTIKKHTLFLSDPLRNPAYVRFIGLTRELLKEPPLISPEGIPYSIWDIETLTQLPPSQTDVSLGFEDSKTYRDLYEAAMTSTKPLVQATEQQIYVDYRILASIVEKIRHDGAAFASHLAISIFIPLIVFNGVMCFWKGEQEIPERAARVGYHFMNRSPNYFGEYYIPIVASSVFDTFIADLEGDFEKLAEKMSKKKDYLDSQIQKVIESRPKGQPSLGSDL